MRAVGKEKFCCYTFLISNGILGIICSFLLAYKAYLKLKGVWIGLIIGIAVNMAC
jgi:Na+-driven multidrug efflux pump